MGLFFVGAPPLELQARLQDLNRRIYASLPWGYRVAQLMLRLSYSLTDTIGRVFYAMFLNAGVEGMPPGAAPGTTPERLPPAYGRAFGQRVYALILQKVKDPNMAELAISNLLLEVSKRRFTIKPGSSLKEAESYVLTSAVRSVIDEIRSQRGRGKYKAPKHYEGIEDIELGDPGAFRELDTLLPRSEMTRLLNELKRIDERAPSWLKAQLEGLTNVELAEQWGVSKPRITGWERDNLPKIKDVVMKYVQDAAA